MFKRLLRRGTLDPLRAELEANLRHVQLANHNLLVHSEGSLDKESRERHEQYLREIEFFVYQLDVLEYNELYMKALQLGIDIPNNEGWWRAYERELGSGGAMVRGRLLTDVGKAGTRRLIKEERRKDIEWRLKIIGSIIAPLTGLVGTIIGLLAILKK